eukprot:gene13255-biopygen20016
MWGFGKCGETHGAAGAGKDGHPSVIVIRVLCKNVAQTALTPLLYTALWPALHCAAPRPLAWKHEEMNRSHLGIEPTPLGKWQMAPKAPEHLKKDGAEGGGKMEYRRRRRRGGMNKMVPEALGGIKEIHLNMGYSAFSGQAVSGPAGQVGGGGWTPHPPWRFWPDKH